MVSERATVTTPFEAMDVLERANELDDVVHLEVGEPDYPTPSVAVEAAIDSLRAGNTGYTPARGKPALREAIAAYYDDRYGVSIDPYRILVTPGSSPGLLLAFLALLDPGDEAILTDPHYACYPNFVRQAGGEISSVPLSSERGFRPALDDFDDALGPETAAVLLNSPANPTGAVLPASTLSGLVDIAADTRTRLVVDEVYHGLSYDGRAASVLEFTDEAFVLDGFSKRFSMTGWRLGWMVVPEGYVDPINRLAQNLLICAPNFVQDAGVAALGVADSHVPEMRETYRARRDFLVAAIDDLGLSLGYTPGGAYYLLVDVRELGDAFDVATDLLEQAGVATTPGRDFGSGAAPYLRLSYATSLDDLEEAVDRLETFLQTARA